MAQTNPLPVPMGPWKVRPCTCCLSGVEVGDREGAKLVLPSQKSRTAGSEAGGTKKTTHTSMPPACSNTPGGFISFFAAPWPGCALL